MLRVRRAAGTVLVVAVVLALSAHAASDAAWRRCGSTPPGSAADAAASHPAWLHPSWSAAWTPRGFLCVYRDDQGDETQRLRIGWPPFA